MSGAPFIRLNPKAVAARGKPRLSLLPRVALEAEALATATGADKYGAFDYLTHPISMSEYADAAMRHLTAFMAGEDLDPESGITHLGHARASLGILLHAQANGNLIDDRAPALVERYGAAE